MEQPILRNKRVLLVDPDIYRRRDLKASLAAHGLVRPREFDTVAAARRRVVGESVDLMIAAASLTDGPAAALVRDVRWQRAGENPFVVMIMLLDDPSSATVGRAIDAGSDDLLVRPQSGSMVAMRMAALARRRKPFVVTTDYIGPDRRAEPRKENDLVELLDVPNPLAPRPADGSGGESLADEIRRVAALINSRSLSVQAAMVGSLIDQMQPVFEGGTVDNDVRPHLERLSELLADMERRLRQTRRTPVAELCRTMYTVLERVRAGPDRSDPRDMRLLRDLGLSIRDELTVER